MNENELRLRAAMQEQAGLVQSLIERAMNLAAENAALHQQNAELTAQNAELMKQTGPAVDAPAA